MEQAPSVESFVRAPVGKWVLAGQTVVWCASRSLCGSTSWGRPDAATASATLRAFDGYDRLAVPFDVIIDGRELELNPDALAVLVAWIRRDLDELRRRVRRQFGVTPAGVDALTLAGIAPTLGFPFPVELVTDPRAAFTALLPDGDGGEALEAEVAAIVARVRGDSPHIVALRAMLRERYGRISLDGAARALGLSTRSLQRELTGAASSFRAEVQDARFDQVARLLETTDDKIEAIAARVGLTKGSLSALVRGRTGSRPTDYLAARRAR